MAKKKSSMDTFKVEVEKNPIFIDHNSSHVFTRGRLLGKGGFGFVYETTMPGYTRRLVLKAIPKARVTKPNQRSRIDNEIDLHKSLKHVNIVNLYHSFEEDHVICMIIERCERSLLDLLQEQNRRVQTEQVSVVARQSLLALEYLHQENVIHRDLKLGNILLKNQLLVKVCDFGLAKRYNPNDKPTICGTPNYLAPEVLQHKGHHPISDVWSLGCVLVVLLTGRAPFEGDTTDETYDLIVNSPLKIPGEVTAETKEFLEALLVKEHATRANVREAMGFDFITMYSHIPAQDFSIEQEDWKMPKARSASKKRDEFRQTSSYNDLNQIYEDESSSEERSDEQIDTRKLDEERWNKLADKADKYSLKDIEEGNCSIYYDTFTDDENGFQLWIQCWIDYTNKDCGFAYRLSNDTIGVKLKADKISYVLKRAIDRTEKHFKYEYFSESRNKLVTFKDSSELQNGRYDERFKKHVKEMEHLVDYYDGYMKTNLINAGNMPNIVGNDICNVRLLDWVKNRQCVAMALSNYTIQVNFFLSHIKIVIQGQFDQPGGFQMPIPQTPSKPNQKRDMACIPLSEHDKKQEFKIMFVNCKRRCFRLNTSLVLYLLANGPKSVHPNCTKELGVEPDELYESFRTAHAIMHNLSCFSDKCYSESLICNAFSSSGLDQPQPNSQHVHSQQQQHHHHHHQFENIKSSVSGLSVKNSNSQRTTVTTPVTAKQNPMATTTTQKSVNNPLATRKTNQMKNYAQH